MNFGLPFLSQIQGADEAVADELDVREVFTTKLGFIVATFRALVAGLTASYHIEHNPDDTHGTIHATGSISERGRTVALGDWQSAPFAAADYTASGAMVWTVGASNIGHVAYMLVGATLLLDFQISSSALSGSAESTLLLRLPGGFQAARDHSATVSYTNGSPNIGRIRILAGESTLRLTTATESAWSLSDPVSVAGQIALEVNVTGAILTASNAYDVEYLIVGGGGGGGTNTLGSGVVNSGGGGAGGFKAGTASLATGLSCAVTVGLGGAVGMTGGGSAVTNIASVSGGGHGGAYQVVGAAGGSGGGNGGDKSGSAAGTGTAGQGHDGGNALFAANTAGGGGGSATAGSNTGAAGAGTASAISGTTVTYAAGGPGGQSGAGTSNPGDGGRGGQGDAGSPAAGRAGIVILRYVGSPRGTGGTVTTFGTYTIHTFTTNGTFVA
jgi:hypothetical protein